MMMLMVALVINLSEYQVYFLFVIDYNECADNVDACEQMCHNSNSSYTCSCKSGYRLADNNRTCDGKIVMKSTYH